LFEIFFAFIIMFCIFFFLLKLGIGLIKIFLILLCPVIILIFLPVIIIPFIVIFGIGFVVIAFLKLIF